MNKTSSRSHAILQIMVEQVYAENKSNEQKQVNFSHIETLSKRPSDYCRLSWFRTNF